MHLSSSMVSHKLCTNLNEGYLLAEQYQTLLLISGDDSEMWYLLGVGAVQNEYFCPYCTKSLDVWRDDDWTPAPLHDLAQMKAYGKEVEVLADLLNE